GAQDQCSPSEGEVAVHSRPRIPGIASVATYCKVIKQGIQRTRDIGRSHLSTLRLRLLPEQPAITNVPSATANDFLNLRHKKSTSFGSIELLLLPLRREE